MTKLSLVAALAVSVVFAGGDTTPTGSSITMDSEVVTSVPTSDFTIGANLAITSNYLWRGMTQTSNSVAFQGGIDLGYKGFYLGTWGSNISWTANNKSSLEADLYVGYANEIAGIGYDIGYLIYTYPNVSNANNFEEAYIGLSKDFGGFGVNGKYSFGMDDAPDDYEIGLSTQLVGLGLSASYGDYDTIGTRYSVAVSKEIGKFELSLGYYEFSSDSDSDEDNIVATISTSF